MFAQRVRLPIHRAVVACLTMVVTLYFRGIRLRADELKASPAQNLPAVPAPTPSNEGTAQQATVELKREALAAAETLAQAFPGDPLTQALLGSAHYNTGHADEAVRHLNRCLELNPKLADGYEVLARVRYDQGQIEESVRLYQEALKYGPPNEDLLRLLGRGLLDLGQADAAIQSLQQAVSRPRAGAESWYLLGQAQLQKAAFAEAKTSFLRVLSLVPNHTQAYFALFTASLRLGQSEEAARYREQFLKLEAADRKELTDRGTQADTLSGIPMVQRSVAQTLFGAAQVYLSHEQPEVAQTLLRRAAKLDEENLTYRAALEAAYLRRKALAEGLRAFVELTAEQPRNSLNFMYRGRFQNRLDQPDAAEQSFRQAQELAPKWAETYRARADLYLRRGQKLPEARDLARQAVELEPTASHFYLLAQICSRLQDRPAAVQAAQQAVTANPREPRYQQFLQQLQAQP